MRDIHENGAKSDTRPGGEESARFGDSSAGLAARFAVLRTEVGDVETNRLLQGAEPERYEFGDTFARGGLGRIRSAFDRRLRRVVAVKELQHHRSGDTSEARFIREALITARLEHPAIIPIHDLGAHDGGEPYYCMKLVEGESLESMVRAARSIAERVVFVPHVLAVADALAYAHKNGVIHRDLKPSNVLVGPFGETVVIDWGLAKDISEGAIDFLDSDRTKTLQDDAAESLTHTGELVGTLPYMPLEQASGQDVGPPADIYAIGALLYFVLSGHPPYEGGNAAAIYHQLLAAPPPDVLVREPAVSADLLAIVRRAMGRTPELRYASAAEFADDLRRHQSGQMISARTYSSIDVLRHVIARHRTVLSVLALSIVMLGGLGMFSYVRISREAAKAEVQRLDAETNRNLAERRGADAEHAARRTQDIALAALINSGRELLLTQQRREKALPVLLEASRLAPNDRTARMLLGEAMISVDALRQEFVVPGAVMTVAFDPTGQRLLALEAGGGAHLWRVDDGAYEELPIDPSLNFTSVGFIGTSGEAMLVHTKDGQILYFAEGRERWRTASDRGMTVPDGAPFALAFDGTGLSEIPLSNGEVRATWSYPWPMTYMHSLGNTNTRHGAIFVAYGPYEANQGVYSQIRVLGWDSARRRATTLLRGFAHNKHSLVVSHDGRWLSLVDSDDRDSGSGHHYLHALGEDRPPIQLDRCETSEGNKLSGEDAVFSSDDRRIIRLMNRHSLVSWDVGSRACVSKASLTGDEFDTIRASRDGRTIVAVGRNGTLAVFNSDSLSLRHQFSVGPTPIKDVALSPDGSMLAVGDSAGHVYLWALADPRVVAYHAMEGQMVPGWDSLMVVQKHEDETISLQQIERRTDGEAPQVQEIGRGSPAESIDVTRHFILAFDARRRVSIWSRSTGERLCTAVDLGGRFSSWFSSESDAHSLVIAEAVDAFGARPLPDSRVVTVDVSTCRSSEPATVPELGGVHLAPHLQRGFSPAFMSPARVFNTRTGAIVATLPAYEDGAVDSFATLFPEGRRLVTGDGFGGIRVFDMVSGDLLAHLREPGATYATHTTGRPAAFFAPDGETFITASPEGPLDVWDVTTLTNRGTLRGHVRTVEALDFSQDSARAVSYSRDGFGDAAVYLWNLDGDGEGLRLPVEGVTSAEFNARGDIVATGTREGSVILWDADDGGVLGRLQGEVSPVAAMLFSDDWRYLVSGSEREVIVWKIPFEARTADDLDALIGSQAGSPGARALPSWAIR